MNFTLQKNLQVHFFKLEQVIPDFALFVDLFVVLAQFLIVKHCLVHVEEERFEPFVHLAVAVLKVQKELIWFNFLSIKENGKKIILDSKILKTF